MTGWQLTQGFATLVFLFSAYIQLNDPDPIAWVGMYLAAASVCALQVRGGWMYSHHYSGIVSITAAAWAFSIGLQLDSIDLEAVFASFQMQSNSVELIREVGGLGLVALWCWFTPRLQPIIAN